MTKTDRVTDDIPVHGEGNHAAGKAYNDRGTEFVSKNPEKVRQAAEEAREAMDGPQGEKLEAERARAAAHAKGQDSTTMEKQNDGKK